MYKQTQNILAYKSLAAFNFNQKLRMSENNLNSIVLDAEKLLPLADGVNFIKDLAPVELNIMCDAQRIRDALLNVITNAVEAMPSGGTLSLSSRKTSFEKMFFDVADECRTGACALLTVSDTGSGMDSYTKEKVEEPFFTTKDGAKGLGFSVAARVIRGHDGIIGIDSSKGTGTTVSIYLPLLTPAYEQLAAIPLPSSLQESYESYRR